MGVDCRGVKLLFIFSIEKPKYEWLVHDLALHAAVHLFCVLQLEFRVKTTGELCVS